MIHVKELHMSLPSGGRNVSILSGVTFTVPEKQRLAIVGRSGSGKSTLLGLLAGLDSPSSGEVHMNGVCVTELDEKRLAQFRRRNIGYVFQSYHLISTLTAKENIAVPLDLQHDQRADTRALELLDAVGLADRAKHYPAQLSGGEQQRVAVARAFANRPPILLADEPTGNLDAASSSQIIDLLLRLNDEYDSTLVFVTHDSSLSRCADRVVTLSDGHIVGDELQ
ncbi:MAG TPA: ABC transporter ATP-binding protein [Nitrospirales bacterium]|nr:ABC transporter ATP-binding protein [Nitrospirales bacterium]HIB54260.1 ABC transporter ATP-binding protein [Nitrospirales bacterium]HIN33551.1 ABC transporter ATP-binding protein [Nitrospirales bacterium]HIO21163.1 ABC transporter ATP-binding protein [Nitrospirales bacterium]